MDPKQVETQALVRVEPVMGLDTVVGDDSSLWLGWDGAIAAWLAAKKRLSGSERTVDTYKMALLQFQKWARDGFGHPEMLVWPVVSSLLAQKWADWLTREGKAIKKGDVVVRREPLAKASVNTKLAALSSFYDFVIHKYTIITPDGQEKSLWPADRRNPFDAVERPEVKAFENAAFLVPEEMVQILEAIDLSNLSGLRDYALLYCFMYTCRRFSELINLKWGDLQPLPDGNFSFSYRAKRGKIKKNVLHRDCYVAICAYLRADGRPPEEMTEKDYIWVPMYPGRIKRIKKRRDLEIEPNKPISNSTANRVLRKRAKRVGITDPKRAHMHGLRHGGLRLARETMEQQGGVDFYKLKELSGHASMEMLIGYSERVLKIPEDSTGDARAARLRSRGRRRGRKKEPAGEQMELGLLSTDSGAD